MNEQVTLKDVSERVDYGVTTSAVLDGDGPRFLRITDIDNSFIDWTGVPRCEISDRDVAKYQLSTGDIVVARTGASTGRSQWVEIDEPAVFASYLVRFRVMENFNSRFIGYVLASTPWHDHVAGIAHGKSAQPNMSASEMARFEFLCPSKPQQVAIAEVLGALDDKIAANTKLASTAAQLTQSLFYRSIHEVSEEFVLSEITDLLSRGITPKYSEESGTMMILNQKCVRGQRVELGPARRTLLAKVREEKVLKMDDVLVNSTGQGTLGRVARWTKTDKVTVDSHITIVRFNEDQIDPVTAGIGLLRMQEAIVEMGEGSTGQTELSRVELGKLKLRLPNRGRQIQLGRRFTELSQMESGHLAENETLAAIRDALLPQLMSGKLRVKDAEKLVSATI